MSQKKRNRRSIWVGGGKGAGSEGPHVAKGVHFLKLVVITYGIKARWYVQNRHWEDHSGSLLENGLEENKTRDKGIT